MSRHVAPAAALAGPPRRSFTRNESASTLLNVGKALWSFDKRIWTHDINGAKYIDLIRIDDRHYPFALALEHFLIGRLKPTWNTQGAGYSIADAGDCQESAIGS